MTQRTSTKPTPGSSIVPNDKLQLLLLHDFRYSLNSIAAGGECLSNLRFFWCILSPHFQAQIQDDIRHYLEFDKIFSYADEWKKILTLPLKDDPR